MKQILKDTNEFGYYEIRLESIGGLGANLCGKLLGEIGALQLDLYAQSFASYGSEKRGSPVKSHIRFANKEIRISSNVEHPHILCLFHENMLKKKSTLNGITSTTKLIINTNSTPDEIKAKINVEVAEIICIDALKFATELNARINIILLGSIIKAISFISLEQGIKVIEENLGTKYPKMLESNLKALKIGFENTSSKKYAVKSKNTTTFKKDPSWGYMNAPIGGINTVIGSSVSQDLSASREGYIPLFILEKCIHCGLCESTCPDFVFQFKEGIYKNKKVMMNQGLDYHHCKGCLRCVEICPTEALVVGVEKEHPNPLFSLPNQDLLTSDLNYEVSGSSSYITSESENNIENFDGGKI